LSLAIFIIGKEKEINHARLKEEFRLNQLMMQKVDQKLYPNEKACGYVTDYKQAQHCHVHATHFFSSHLVSKHRVKITVFREN
jgi:hypothetical protein